jgi:hypothetical protein
MLPRVIAHRLSSANPALPGAIVPRPHFCVARSRTLMRRARFSSNAGVASKSEPCWTARSRRSRSITPAFT